MHNLRLPNIQTVLLPAVAVASNDCTKDHLHKDCCAQAFGRNTLSKLHSIILNLVNYCWPSNSEGLFDLPRWYFYHQHP